MDNNFKYGMQYGQSIDKASLKGKVAEEVWTGNPIDLRNLRIFGSPAYAQISSEDRSKLDPKSRRCILTGYNRGVKG